MTETDVQSASNLPYRARIMMTNSNIDNNNSTSNKTNFVSGKFSNVNNMKPMMNARKDVIRSAGNIMNSTSYNDLQPLQWLHQDAILSITPLDNEDEFVPGKDDIISISTSPIKVDIIAEEPRSDDSMCMPNSTIADFYRYQAMRAAMSSGHGNGMRSSAATGGGGGNGHNGGSNCHQANEYQKPPFSYTHIIFMAIETSPHKAMTVNDIYVWCETHFPYYTQAGVGWKNSLRHNLSINKSFKKISRDGRGGPGRGAYWIVEPRERSNLIDAIRRSPCSLGNLPFITSSTLHKPYHLTTAATTVSTATVDPNLNTNLSSTLTLPSSVTCAGTLSSASSSTSSTSILANRGPLLRIGGQLTDASQLIRSTPVIQRLRNNNNPNDTATFSFELGTNSTATATPLIQLDHHLSFEPASTNQTAQIFYCVNDNNNSNKHSLSTELDTNNSNDNIDDYYHYDNEMEWRGKVVYPTIDTNGLEYHADPEVEHSFYEMLRNLVDYDEIDKVSEKSPAVGTISTTGANNNNNNDTVNSKCLEYGNKKRNSSLIKNNCHDSGVVEDMLPTEDISSLKKQSNKPKKKCTCPKLIVSDTDDSEISYSNDEFSEMSDTDFNWKMNIGRRNRHKDKRSVLNSSSSVVNSTKAPRPNTQNNTSTLSTGSQSQSQQSIQQTKQRKSLQHRTRINSIIRAPHSDHVYAFLQEFLLPVNLSVQEEAENARLHPVPNTKVTRSSREEYIDSSLLSSSASFSKRSKRKFEANELSTIRNTNYTDSEDNQQQTDDCLYSDLVYNRQLQKQKRSSKFITKFYNVKNPRKLCNDDENEFICEYETPVDEGEEEYENEIIEENIEDGEDEYEEEEFEEQENRFYEYTMNRTKQTRVGIKREEIDVEDQRKSWMKSRVFGIRNSDSQTTNNNKNVINNSNLMNVSCRKRKKSIGGSREFPLIKRKVGRPRKSDANCDFKTVTKTSNNRILKKTNSTKKIKRENTKRKYFHESNVNERTNAAISNNEEQTAIKILANLHRKTQRQRINNMYHLTSYLDINNDEDNMSNNENDQIFQTSVDSSGNNSNNPVS